MNKITYRWKRFWVPQKGKMHVDQRGYLQDPEEKNGKVLNPDVVSWEDLKPHFCLVLLGEPGMGKSHVLNNTHGDVANDERSLIFKLGDYESVTDLRSQILQNLIWQQSNTVVHLFFDGLDEWKGEEKPLRKMLFDCVDQRTTTNLRFRIVCRTARWSTRFESELEKRWNVVSVYEICRLRRVDVKSAAHAHGLDSEQTLDKFYRHNADAFAQRPIALSFLLKRLEKGQPLPSSKIKVYEQLCKDLCKETDEDRKRSDRSSPEIRFALSKRIAASLLLGNKTAVCTKSDDLISGDLSVEELVGDRECIEGDLFAEASDPAIRDALDSALFDGRGLGRLGFAHRSFAEFMAASYIATHFVDNEKRLVMAQVRKLFLHSHFARIVPQLHGVSAWLASMDNDFFEFVLPRDSQVLLEADLSTFDDEKKARIAECVLQGYSNKEHLGSGPFSRPRFDNLAHAGLAEQLRPYLLDENIEKDARFAAIEIAESCKVVSLGDALLAVVESRENPISMRINAAIAIGELGNDDDVQRLRPFAIASDPLDERDDLRGRVLHYLWPNHISFSEVFTILSGARPISHWGSFVRFFSWDFAPQAKDEDLVTLLEWTKNQQSRRLLARPASVLIDSIFESAWKKIEYPSVLEAYARAVFRRMQCLDLHFQSRDGAENYWKCVRILFFSSVVFCLLPVRSPVAATTTTRLRLLLRKRPRTSPTRPL